MPYAKINIKAGEIISFSNTKFLRSNQSKNFFDLENIIGKKVKKVMKKNQLINKKNLV